MTPAETATVLAKAAAYDRRTVGRADVAAWHEVLHDIDHSDALAAVTAHYRNTRDWLTPADIRDRVRDIRAARSRHQAPPLALPSRYETDTDRDARLARGVQTARAVLPERSTSDTQALAVARARRERGRPERPNPIPKRRRPPRDWPAPQNDDIAALATRYLLDGYPPADVADRLAVYRTWCQRTLRRLRPNRPEETQHVDPPAA